MTQPRTVPTHLVVNGRDRAALVAGYGRAFLGAVTGKGAGVVEAEDG